MKKPAVWAAVAVLTLSALIGLGRDVNSIVAGGGGCPPPLTLSLTTDRLALYQAIDQPVYNVAGRYKGAVTLDWQPVATFRATPTQMDVLVAVGTEWTEFGPLGDKLVFYRVRLSRDCAGGAWHVDTFRVARLHLPPKS